MLIPWKSRRRFVRPRLEALEDRCLPAAILPPFSLFTPLSAVVAYPVTGAQHAAIGRSALDSGALLAVTDSSQLVLFRSGADGQFAATATGGGLIATPAQVLSSDALGGFLSAGVAVGDFD